MQAFLLDHWLLILGFSGQALFGARFLIQWIASEFKQESHIPIAFWYFSILGGCLLLVYAVLRRDPVFMLGQSMGLIVYCRNLMLINKKNSSADSASL